MKKKRKNNKKKQSLIGIILALIIIICIGLSNGNVRNYIGDLLDGENVKAVFQSAVEDIGKRSAESTKISFSINAIPKFRDEPYVIINNNKPDFSEEELTTKAFEKYSELDTLGRCGVAYANICKELMPKEARGEIGMVKPSGWQIAKYNFVDGKYLYNRCHLIGFQLAGENANEKNLITGTRYLNVEGMLPFENKVAEYVKTKNKHVLYRVTPIFKDQNLVANGVQMEAMSVEDKGKSICFNVYIYNNQPGVEINYRNGKSQLAK